ncbi:HvfC/BufC N-terminal domain-containing protein [Lysobacter terrae]
MLLRADESLRARQDAFSRALLDPDRDVPAGLVGPDGAPSARRFAVYRNNVVLGLVDALKSAFPATCRIVGDEFFVAMARVHATQTPPDSPVMLDYGRHFADFLADFAPVDGLPYLPDVARLERAWVEAYHAPEADPLLLARLAEIDHGRLPQTRLHLHPSLRVVRSEYPIVTIWCMNIEDQASGSVDLGAGGQNALVVRPEASVEIRTVSHSGAVFVETLQRGATLAEASAAAIEANRDIDLTELFADLFSIGALIGFGISSVAPFDEELQR